MQDLQQVLVLLLGSVVASDTLTCNLGGTPQSQSCTTTTVGTYPYQAQNCTKSGHSCLTGNYAGGTFAAYGCYPDSVIAGTKTFYTDACKADATCNKYDPDGPTFTVCKTDSCNKCGAEAGPTLICKLGAASQADKSCATTTCPKSSHSCLTGHYAHGRDAAYGCYADSVMETTKAAIVAACKADTLCMKYNPNGPESFTACTEDNCNACNGAGAITPSLAVLVACLLASTMHTL